MDGLTDGQTNWLTDRLTDCLFVCLVVDSRSIGMAKAALETLNGFNLYGNSVSRTVNQPNYRLIFML